jgi:hypothetical protein
MRELALTSGPKIAGRRVPVPTVKRKRHMPGVVGARRTAGDAVKSAGAAAKSAGAAARTASETAGKTAGAAAKTAGRTAAHAARSAPHAAAGAGHLAGSAKRSARSGAETTRAAVRFAHNVKPRPRQPSARTIAVHRAPAVTAAIAAGVGLEYLLDPADGRRRRRALRDQTLAAGRRFAPRGAHRARYTGGETEGAIRGAASTPRPADDETRTAPGVHSVDDPLHAPGVATPTGGRA